MPSERGRRADCSPIVVFTGPSLHPCEAGRLLQAKFLPPIKRGDLAPVYESKPAIIAIIDGEFYQSLAVTPKEVLMLLEAGVAVYGAASMGALRAVELDRYGMIGVGSVYRLFRRGVLDADDEVALVYSKQTFQALSEPLVNIRYALRASVRRGVLSRTEVDEIIAPVKAAYFPERTRGLVLSIADRVVGTDRACALRDFFRDDRYNIKKRDALLLLDRVRTDCKIICPSIHI